MAKDKSSAQFQEQNWMGMRSLGSLFTIPIEIMVLLHNTNEFFSPTWSVRGKH